MRVLLQVAKVAVSAAIIFYLSIKLDLLDAFAVMLRQKPVFLAAGTVIICIQIAIAAARWLSILAALAGPISASRLIGAFYVAAFLNTCFPAGVAGDAARIWLVRAGEIGVVRAFNSVLIDRVIAVLTLLVLCTAMEPFVWQRIMVGREVFLIIPALAAAGALAVAALAHLDRIDGLDRMLRALRLGGLASVLQRLALDWRAVFRADRRLAATFALGLASYAAVGLAVYVFAVGLEVDIGLAECQLVMPIVLLVTSLPISIGGWGPRELAMVYLLGVFGVPSTEALTLSVEFGVCGTLAALPGAVVWIMWRRDVGTGVSAALRGGAESRWGEDGR